MGSPFRGYRGAGPSRPPECQRYSDSKKGHASRLRHQCARIQHPFSLAVAAARDCGTPMSSNDELIAAISREFDRDRKLEFVVETRL
jgi:hypothetical protein